MENHYIKLITMTETQFQAVADLNKLNDLKFRKKPIILEFYTEYLCNNLDGVLPANLSIIF